MKGELDKVYAVQCGICSQDIVLNTKDKSDAKASLLSHGWHNTRRWKWICPVCKLLTTTSKPS